MTRIAMLRQDEPVRLDTERLARLLDGSGGATAGSFTRALTELALRLSAMEQHYVAGDLAQVSRAARCVGTLARQIGMISLARVADDARHCARRGDMTALAAIRERLDRIGRRSFTEVRQRRGISG